jgi:pimeloyl-ACP methyl ester carboxylesterase
VPHITLEETRFYYQQKGEGPDVVLVHAVTSNLAVWVFINLFDTLAADFRVTAYDLRGHGHSDVTPTGYTSAEMAGDLQRLHAALNLGPAYLVGHSFGGVVALHTAVLYPDLVAGLLIADTYFPGLQHLEPNLGDAGAWQDLRDVFGRVGVDLPEQVDFDRLFRAAADLSPAQLDTVRKDMGAPSLGWLAQLPRLATTTCGTDVFAVAGLTAERIAAVGQPVVALYDEHTPFPATRRYLEENLANCKVDVVPGARHVAPLQNSREFVRLVHEHLLALRRTDCQTVQGEGRTAWPSVLPKESP